MKKRKIIVQKIKIEKEDINKNIYFLDNYVGFDRQQHNHLKELNEFNSEIFINNKKFKYEKYFYPRKKDYMK